MLPFNTNDIVFCIYICFRVNNKRGETKEGWVDWHGDVNKTVRCDGIKDCCVVGIGTIFRS
jgi:hypothetical protein